MFRVKLVKENNKTYLCMEGRSIVCCVFDQRHIFLSRERDEINYHVLVMAPVPAPLIASTDTPL